MLRPTLQFKPQTTLKGCNALSAPSTKWNRSCEQAILPCGHPMGNLPSSEEHASAETAFSMPGEGLVYSRFCRDGSISEVTRTTGGYKLAMRSMARDSTGMIVSA